MKPKTDSNTASLAVVGVDVGKEVFHVSGWGSDPRLVSQCPEHSADKMRAQAGFHANDARSQPLEGVFETQSPDLSPEGNLPVSRRSTSNRS
jgi:hypothetical protein